MKDYLPNAYRLGKLYRKWGWPVGSNPFSRHLTPDLHDSWRYGYTCQARGEKSAESRKENLRTAA